MAYDDGDGVGGAELSSSEAALLRDRISERLARHQARLQAHKAALGDSGLSAAVAAPPVPRTAAAEYDDVGRHGYANGDAWSGSAAARTTGNGSASFVGAGTGSSGGSGSGGGAGAREAPRPAAAHASYSEPPSAGGYTNSRRDAPPLPPASHTGAGYGAAGATSRSHAHGDDDGTGTLSLLDAHTRHLAELRHQQAQAEAAAAAAARPTFTPTINHNVPVRQHGDVVERSNRWMAQREAKAESLRTELAQKEVSELRAAPEIDRRSSRIAGRQSRDSRRVAEDAGTDSPGGAGGGGGGGGGGDAAHAPRHERLHADAERRRNTIRELKEQQLADEVLGYPAITKKAAELVRDKDVGERLYQSALEQKRKREEAIELREKELDAEVAARAAEGLRATKARRARSSHNVPGLRHLSSARGGHDGGGRDGRVVDSATNFGAPIAPEGSTGAAGARAHRSVARGEILYKRAQMSQQKKEADIAREKEESLKQAKPQLNRRSLAIAGGLKSTAKERLMGAHKVAAQKARLKRTGSEAGGSVAGSVVGSVSSPPGSLIDGVEGLGGSPGGPGSVASAAGAEGDGVKGGYTPRSISAQTKAVVMARKWAERGRRAAIKKQEAAGDRLYKNSRQIENKKVLARKATMEKELEGCTFKPELSKGTLKKSEKVKKRWGKLTATARVVGHAQSNMYHRQLAWQAAKDEKVYRAQLEMADTDLEGCTFKPVISRGPVDGRGGVDDGLHGPRGPTGGGDGGGGGAFGGAHGGSGSVVSGAPKPSTPLESTAPGVKEFLERQQRARQVAREKEETPFSDGSKWTGTVTRAASPKLKTKEARGKRGAGVAGGVVAGATGGMATGAEIRSLRRPVADAHDAEWGGGGGGGGGGGVSVAEGGGGYAARHAFNGADVGAPAAPTAAAVQAAGAHPGHDEGAGGYARRRAARQVRPAGASLRDELTAQVRSLVAAADAGDGGDGSEAHYDSGNHSNVPLPAERDALAAAERDGFGSTDASGADAGFGYAGAYGAHTLADPVSAADVAASALASNGNGVGYAAASYGGGGSSGDAAFGGATEYDGRGLRDEGDYYGGYGGGDYGGDDALSPSLAELASAGAEGYAGR